MQTGVKTSLRNLQICILCKTMFWQEIYIRLLQHIALGLKKYNTGKTIQHNLTESSVFWVLEDLK